MKHERIFTKTEAESEINKKGEPGKWHNLENKAPDYWTEASLRKRSIKEMYPKGEAESDEAYAERLKRIGEYALKKDPSLETPPKPGKYYPYEDYQGQPAHTVIHGYRFDAHTPEAVEAAYNQVFAERLKNQEIMDAVSDEIQAREDNTFEFAVNLPKSYEKQKELARYFVGPLDYRERSKYVGKFQDVGSERYSLVHAAKVDRWKEKFLQNDEKEEDKIEDKIDGRILESFFYPLTRVGFFDAPTGKHPAATILTSDYDDFHHKADTAVFLPVKNGEEAADPIYYPIGFDLTIGHGGNKISKIKEKFNKSHGLTEIEYPSTCYKRELGPMKDVPHFILCLPRDGGEFASFNESLASGKMPPQDIQDLINYEIYAQARYWAGYWSNQAGYEEVQEKFRQIANYFSQKLELNTKGAKLINLIHSRHPGATRFISELLFKP